MVGLAAFGTMNAMLAAGARIAARARGRLEPPAALTPLSTRTYFRTKVLTGYVMAASDDRPALRRGRALGVRLSAGEWVRMTALHPHRPDPVRRARHPARAPADGRLDRPGDRRHHRAARVARRRLVPDHGSGAHARHRAGAAVVLARAGQPTSALGGTRLGRARLARRWRSGRSALAALAVRAYRRDTGR